MTHKCALCGNRYDTALAALACLKLCSEGNDE